MAHFAEIDGNGVVLRVLVTDNNKPNEGYDWLVERLGGTWIKTSYNTRAGVHIKGGTPLRKNFAGIGYTYDEALDAFIPPKPYESWVLDQETGLWEAPTPYPTDGVVYKWDEATTDWVPLVYESGTSETELTA